MHLLSKVDLTGGGGKADLICRVDLIGDVGRVDVMRTVDLIGNLGRVGVISKVDLTGSVVFDCIRRYLKAELAKYDHREFFLIICRRKGIYIDETLIFADWIASHEIPAGVR